jgi:hypothetical protein
VKPERIPTPEPPPPLPAGRPSLFHPHETTFAEDLQRLLDLSDTQQITIGGLEQSLRGRGFAVLVILLAAPFVIPLPSLGLSTPFGLAIALIGVRIGLGMHPWLPGFILRRRIKHDYLVKLLRAAMRIARPMEKIVRPRWSWFFVPGVRNLHGWFIALAAVLLLLPLPLPGTNFIPAFPIILVAAGLMERDGLFSFCGYLTVLIAVGIFVMLMVLGVDGTEALWHHFFGHPAVTPTTAPHACLGLIRHFL